MAGDLVSRGIGRFQQAILGELALAAMCTGYLHDRLAMNGLINRKRPRRETTGAVLRACRSLRDRGWVKGSYVVDAGNRTMLVWELN